MRGRFKVRPKPSLVVAETLVYYPLLFLRKLQGSGFRMYCPACLRISHRFSVATMTLHGLVSTLPTLTLNTNQIYPLIFSNLNKTRVLDFGCIAPKCVYAFLHRLFVTMPLHDRVPGTFCTPYSIVRIDTYVLPAKFGKRK
jgi:hypothetical protein